jgi:enolase
LQPQSARQAGRSRPAQPAGAERIVKYNRLREIEAELGQASIFVSPFKKM